MDKRKIVIPWISLSCILMGMLLSFGSAFECDINMEQHILPVILIAGVALFLILCLGRKYSVIFTLSAIAVMGIFVLTQIARLQEDFLSIVYYINRKSLAYNDTVFTSYKGVMGDMNYNLLLGIIGVLLALFIAVFAFRLRSRWYGLLPVYAVVYIGMSVGMTPDKTAVAFLIVGVALALAWISYQERGGRRFFKMKKLKKQRSALSYIILCVILAAGMAAAWYCGQQTEEQFLMEAETYLERQHEMERQVKYSVEQMVQYVRSRFRVDSDGNLINAEPYYENKEVLEITTDIKPTTALYLRGFTGGEYQDGKWKECDTKAFREIAPTQEDVISLFETNYYFWNDNVAENYLFEEEEYTEEENRKSQIKIEYVGDGKHSKYAYIPYFADVEGIYNDDTKNCVKMDGENGIRKKENEFYVCCYVVKTETLSEKMEEMERFFQDDEDKWLGNTYPGMEGEEVRRYLEYVENMYCRLPEKGMDRLQRLSEVYEPEYAGNAFELADKVQQILSQRAVYAKDLEPVPAGQDYVDYFLFTQKKGFCEHFATAGALLLRTYGIPARYVSGYKVTPDQFEKNEDGSYTAKILDSDAHAWSEVFSSWCGWVPAEMTPGEGNTSRAGESTVTMMQTAQPAADHSLSEEEEITQTETPEDIITPTPVPTKEPEGMEKEASENKQADKMAEKKNRVVFVGILLLIFVFMLFGSYLLYQRHFYLRYKKRLLCAGEDKNAVIRARTAMFIHFLKRSGMHSLDRKSEAEWFEELAKECTEADERVWKQLKEIIQEAEFSDKSVSQEKFDFFLSTVPKMEQIILDKKNKVIRLYLMVCATHYRRPQKNNRKDD